MKSRERKTILLVEDEVVTAMAESHTLKKYGYNVITALSGKEALDTFKTNDIDLILMDIDLGRGIDGTQTAALMLKEKDIPIVFLSNHTEPEIVEKTEQITSYGYVVKNSGITVLDTSIKMAFKLFEANQKTEKNKQHLKATLNSIGDAMIATDSDGNITEMNPVAEKLTCWKSEDAIGKTLEEVFVLTSQDQKPVKNPVQKALQSGKTVDLANHTVLIAKDGTEYQIADSAAPIIDSENFITGVVLVFRDVTKEYKMQEKIAASQKKYKALYEGMIEGVCHHEIIYNDKGDAVDYRIIDTNPKYEKILHLKKKDIIGKPATEVYQTDKAPYLDLYYRVVQTGTPERFEIYFAPMKKHLAISVFSPGKDKFVTVFEDITKRKQAEAKLKIEQEKITSILESMTDGIYIVNKYHDIQYVNPALKKAFGSPDGKKCYKYFNDFDKPCPFCKNKVVFAGKTVRWELTSPRNGKTYDLIGTPFKNTDGNISKLEIFRNITERKQAEQVLQTSLQKNKDLLRELQHRAKNSFSMIFSLISLSANSSTSETTKSALNEIGSRVQAVSEIYDLLYTTDSVSEVQLDEYFTRIAASFLNLTENITLKQICDKLTVPVKNAIPIGIIITELITNSIKYAFSGNRKGTISLSLKKTKSGGVIKVTDDGEGLPEGFDISTIESLGLILVSGLTNQINGSFKIESKNGTRCTLKFPLEEIHEETEKV